MILFKKHLISPTIIVRVHIFTRNDIPVPLTPAPAKGIPAAIQAFPAQPERAFHKTDFLLPPGNIREAVRIEVSQAILIQHIEIARVNAPIRLHRALNAAYAAMLTGFGRITEEDAKIIFKLPNIRRITAFPVCIPQIKQVAKKLSVLFRGQGISNGAVPRSQRFQADDILRMAPAAFFVRLLEFPHVFRCVPGYDGKNVVLDPAAVKHRCGFQHPVKGAVSGGITAIVIMRFPRSIHGQADQKLIIREKAAPLLIQRKPVCLESIMDAQSGTVKVLLERYGFLIEIQAAQGGFASLIGIADDSGGVQHGFSDHVALGVL